MPLHSVSDDIQSLFARDDDISTSVFDTIEEGTHVNASAEQQMKVVSNSTSDTGAGVGAQKVMITYLDSAFVQFTEIVTMNGTTAVNTVATNIKHIERMEVIQAGTTGSNVGIISLTNLAGSESYASIHETKNESFACVHHVPMGKRCYVLAYSIRSFSSGAITFRLSYEKDFTSGGKIEKIYMDNIVANYGTVSVGETFPLFTVEGGNHVRMLALGSQAATSACARIFFKEVDI